MPHPCADRMISISVRDLAVLLVATPKLNGIGPDNPVLDLDRLCEVQSSYGSLLTRMAGGSEAWWEG